MFFSDVYKMFRAPKSGTSCLPLPECDIRHKEIVTSNLVLHRTYKQVWLKRLRVPTARRPPS